MVTVARRIAKLPSEGLTGVLHVGGDRRTVIDVARSLSNGPIGEMSVRDVGFRVPVDTSLISERHDVGSMDGE